MCLLYSFIHSLSMSAPGVDKFPVDKMKEKTSPFSFYCALVGGANNIILT